MTSVIESHEDLDGGLQAAAWGVFCLFCGVVLLVPALPDGTWLAGTGAIILGFAALRANLGLPNSAFWSVMGIGFATFGAGHLPAWRCPGSPG